MPEPVPPDRRPTTEIVTTLGLALAATAVIWFTDSVSFTTMFWADSAVSLTAVFWLLAMRAVMPAPEAPPIRAAATIAAATPRPTLRCLGAAGAGVAPFGAPVTGTVGWRLGSAEGGRHLAGHGLGRRDRGSDGRGGDRSRRGLLRVLRRVVRLRGLAGLVDGAGRGGGDRSCGGGGCSRSSGRGRSGGLDRRGRSGRRCRGIRFRRCQGPVHGCSLSGRRLRGLGLCRRCGGRRGEVVLAGLPRGAVRRVSHVLLLPKPCQHLAASYAPDRRSL